MKKLFIWKVYSQDNDCTIIGWIELDKNNRLFEVVYEDSNWKTIGKYVRKKEYISKEECIKELKKRINKLKSEKEDYSAWTKKNRLENIKGNEKMLEYITSL